MARVRIFEAGPTFEVSPPGRVTTSTFSDDIVNSVYRIKAPRNSVTSKSRMAKKSVRGITPPGYPAPNYSDPLY